MPKPTPDSLQADAVENLRLYVGGEGDTTQYLRNTAEALVSAREHFFTKDGEPDWLGRTYHYKRWLRDVYSLANLTAEQLPKIQNSLRYHASNVIRDGRLTPEQMADLGLRTVSARERAVEKRSNHSATLSVFGGGGPEIIDPEEILEALRKMDVALRRVSLDGIANSRNSTRREIAELASEIHRFCLQIDQVARA